MLRMKKIVLIFVTAVFWSCGDDFLDNPPNIGLTPDKLTDLAPLYGIVSDAWTPVRAGYVSR